MNDDYDKHIVQKYRLAVAIAIVRHTPNDSNPKLYLEHLKRNIIPEMDFDSDVTICEDDFEFNDDDNEAINDNANNDNANKEIEIIDSQTNDSVTILKDFDFNVMMQNMNNLNNTETILKDSDFNFRMQNINNENSNINNENNNNIENDSVSDVLRILKGVGDKELQETEAYFAKSDGDINHMKPAYNEDFQSVLQQKKSPIVENIEHLHGNNAELAQPGTSTDNRNNTNSDLKNKQSNIKTIDYAPFCDSQIKAHALGNNVKLTLSGATTYNSNSIINDMKNQKNNINSVDNVTCESQTKGYTHGSTPKFTLNGATVQYGNNKMNDLKTNINLVDDAIFRDSQMATYDEYTDNFTHFSQSQIDNIVLPRYLIEKEKPKDKSKLPDNENKQNINNYTNANITADKDKPLTNIISRSNENTNKIHGNTEMVTINDVNIIKDKKHKFASQESKPDKAKRSRNLGINVHSDTDIAYYKETKNKFDITSSIDSEVSLNYNLKTRPNRFINLTNADIIVNSQEFSDTNDTDFNKFDNNLSNNNTSTMDNFESQFSNKSSNPNKIAYGSQAFSQISFEFDTDSSTVETTMTSQVTKQKYDSESSNVDVVTSQLTKTVDAKEDSEEEIEELFNELTDSQAEVVPFKVLEELNKVKSFLNKRNRGGNSGYASDSGYRSDSQSRSSFRSALQPNTGLNQSAHCLLTYLATSPMAVNTEDITNEISRTLGHLIDRLHEQEKCPSFLEEHLQVVDKLLKEIYEEESDDMVMEKEERIHRIFLLNKSSHIIKHTAEKILIILEQILSVLNENEPLEVSRTIQIENLAYIFHILETLIKKLILYKSLSQSTQNSQEDEIILKRSSITDIWRKKWNPTKKCDASSSSAKPCVLVRCSEVLNKLIVTAMDGYSLISYYALQCFNLLQN